jgi:transcription elongation factor GreB
MSDKKHYVTPSGMRKYQEELKHLKSVERPEVTNTVAWAASNGDRSENADYQYGKRRLRQIDSRIRFLLKRIETAEVIDPVTIKNEAVTFGATVTILTEDDKKISYTIVGIDEGDLSKKRISYQSPLGNALLKGKEGDFITYNTPKGEQSVEIVKIQYLPVE